MTAASSNSQPTALILIADGTEETEFVTTYDVLVRAGFSTISVGVNLKQAQFAQCSRGVKIVPDALTIEHVKAAQVDKACILVLPGGAPGAATFCNSQATTELVRQFRNDGKHVAFICAATTALVCSAETATQDSIASQKCKVTSHPSVKDQIVQAGWQYADDSENVVIDGKVITSRGPGTAMAFALAIVEELLDRAKRDEVQRPMIVT